jgi:hypothetical protein
MDAGAGFAAAGFAAAGFALTAFPFLGIGRVCVWLGRGVFPLILRRACCTLIFYESLTK